MNLWGNHPRMTAKKEYTQVPEGAFPTKLKESNLQFD